MIAATYAATALLIKKKYLTKIWPLLVAVQLPALVCVALHYAGIGHSYCMSFSHSILSVLALALLAGLFLRKALHRPVMGTAVAIGIASNLPINIVMRPDVPVSPFAGGPELGLGLYALPLLATTMETGYGVLCWRVYNGRKALLAGIILLNLLSAAFLFNSSMPALASFTEGSPYAFATFVLFQILVSSCLVYYFSRKTLSSLSPEQLKREVSEHYSKVATAPHLNYKFPVGRRFAESVGYPAGLLDGLPRGLWESFTGAGNPHGYAGVRTGERLLDLGCGAGLDLYIYSRGVGPSGKVFGLDISETMLDKARKNLSEAGVTNFELVRAPSDRIPFPDCSFDIVTANGIYNLSPDKDSVMREVHRVLKKGGRTVFAEAMVSMPLEKEVQTLDEWFRCIGGALTLDEFLTKMRSHGFRDPQVMCSGKNMRTGHELALSAVIHATK